MSNKPDKFDIKFWLAVDVQTKCILNPISYLEKNKSRAPYERLSDWVAMNLIEPFLGKGRNVTTDNIFTSLKLAYDLKQKEPALWEPRMKQEESCHHLQKLCRAVGTPVYS